MEHRMERLFEHIFCCAFDFDFSCKCCCFPCCCHCSASQHTTTVVGGSWGPADIGLASSDVGRPPLAFVGTQPSKSEPMYASQAHDVKVRANSSPLEFAASSPEQLRASADVVLSRHSPAFAGHQGSMAQTVADMGRGPEKSSR